MLDKLIKFSDKVKETTNSNVNVIYMGATIERESGNIKVINYFSADVEIWSDPYKGKTVLSASSFENNDEETRIGGEIVDIPKLKTHLENIGLQGIANKLHSRVNTMRRYEEKDVAKALQNSNELKEYFKDFVMYELLTEEERKEYREAK